MLVTVFTPTYNRASHLPRLYDSLIAQCDKDFEWVVVDDGSSDKTEELIKSWMLELKISIVYFKQENSGKHIAINKGVELAKGELFFIVDSDDFLLDNAIRFIRLKYEKIKLDDKIAGVSGRKGFDESRVIGSRQLLNGLIASSLDLRYSHKVTGDMAEVVKTSVMRKFLFPVIKGEKFCTEGLIWSRIAVNYNFVWYDDIIYIVEYLAGGLSATSFLSRKSSPRYATLYYAEHEKLNIPYAQKLRANINYWRFIRFVDDSFPNKLGKVNFFRSLLGLPMSQMFRLFDR